MVLLRFVGVVFDFLLILSDLGLTRFLPIR